MAKGKRDGPYFKRRVAALIKAPKTAKPAEAAFYILDKFSAHDIERWDKRYRDLYDYYWDEYSYYAQLRSRKAESLRESLLSCTTPYSFQNWCRVIDYQYSNTPLSAVGSKISARGGRFNFGLIDEKFPSFASLYIGESEETAKYEKFQKAKANNSSELSPTDFGLKTEASYIALRLEGKLEVVLDLTDDSNLKPFLKQIKKLSPPEDFDIRSQKLGLNLPNSIRSMKQLKDGLLDHSWSAQPMGLGIPSNSQIFGHIAKSAGIHGILYQSKFNTGKCLAVFPDNIDKSTSYVQIVDPIPSGIIGRLDHLTWKTLV
jgi:hypothetical protein